MACTVTDIVKDELCTAGVWSKLKGLYRHDHHTTRLYGYQSLGLMDDPGSRMKWASDKTDPNLAEYWYTASGNNGYFIRYYIGSDHRQDHLFVTFE
jgi:hypothetical protein